METTPHVVQSSLAGVDLQPTLDVGKESATTPNSGTLGYNPPIIAGVVSDALNDVHGAGVIMVTMSTSVIPPEHTLLTANSSQTNPINPPCSPDSPCHIVLNPQPNLSNGLVSPTLANTISVSDELITQNNVISTPTSTLNTSVVMAPGASSNNNSNLIHRTTDDVKLEMVVEPNITSKRDSLSSQDIDIKMDVEIDDISISDSEPGKFILNHSLYVILFELLRFLR